MYRLKRAGGLVLLQLLVWPFSAAATEASRVTCEVTENGQPGSGTVTLVAGDREVASGNCGGRPVLVPPGTYSAVLRLDGALDAPEIVERIEAGAGKIRPLRGEFATGLLDVRIQKDGRDIAGIAVIRKAGRQIGTVGSGVTACLSTGSYEVIARYRTDERRFDSVRIEKAQRTSLSASF